jgi:fucose 4-O-acetylase-like acetyltransferase
VNTNRLTFIDIARAICIILVVIYHYRPENSPDWYLALNNIAVSFRIPLLMFISGYIYTIAKKTMKYKDFVFNKFKRLIVPYFFVSILIIFIKLLTEKDMYLENPVSISSFYEMFYFPAAGFFIWFVYALFLIFLIIPFIDTPQKLTVFLIISLIILLIPIPSSMYIFYLAQLKGYLFYFVFGCFIATKTNIKLIIDKIPSVIFLAFFAILYAVKLVIHTEFIPLLNLFLSVSGIFFIISISMRIDKKANSVKSFFVKLSSYTYTIYLFHTTAEGFAKSVLRKTSLENYLTPDFYFIFNAFFIIMLGIFAPVFLHKIVVSKSRLFSFLIGIKYTSEKKEIRSKKYA